MKEKEITPKQFKNSENFLKFIDGMSRKEFRKMLKVLEKNLDRAN